ncbi:SpoIIE family protein phosphatase [Streptomyces sp. NPDC007157]|uniref:SpoIIE family protein phosphatase n=1 Tax=Streptomyces sp. NPDC007157 TaxID=3154681 RepID=UPI0033E6653F
MPATHLRLGPPGLRLRPPTSGRLRPPTSGHPLPPPDAQRSPPPASGAVLALYTDGLIERPGTDVLHATADLAAHLARADVHDLEHLIDSLVHHTWPAGGHTDDVAVLLLRTAAAAGPDRSAGLSCGDRRR